MRPIVRVVRQIPMVLKIVGNCSVAFENEIVMISTDVCGRPVAPDQGGKHHASSFEIECGLCIAGCLPGSPLAAVGPVSSRELTAPSDPELEPRIYDLTENYDGNTGGIDSCYTSCRIRTGGSGFGTGMLTSAAPLRSSSASTDRQDPAKSPESGSR